MTRATTIFPAVAGGTVFLPLLARAASPGDSIADNLFYWIGALLALIAVAALYCRCCRLSSRRACSDTGSPMRRRGKDLAKCGKECLDLLDGSNSIVLRLSPEGKILYMNRFGLRFFGYDEEELVGRDLVGSIVPRTDSTGRSLVEMGAGIVASPEEYIHNENENVCKDGRRVRVTWSNKGLYGRGGALREILSIGNDVTETYRIREENRESRERFELLMNSIDQGFWLREGGRLTCVSTGFQRIFGVSPEEVAEDPFKVISVIHTEDQERIRQALLGDEYLEKGHLHQEFRFIGPDGRQRWGLARAYPTYRGDELVRIVGLVEDVTKYREIVSDLEQAKESIESADRAKSQFLANMSHEFRTPLNGIIGMLQLLDMAALPEKEAEYVRTATRSAETLMVVLNSVLEYIDIESGRARYSRQPFSVPNLLQGLRQTVLARAEAKGVALEMETEKSCPDVLTGDFAHLRQAMLKILSNALKYTDRGEVRMRTWCVEHSPEESEHELELMLEVSDTGQGIPRAALSRVFDAFSQGETGYVRRDRGAGLGLGIVKRLVSLMGGGLALESEEGKGTTLTIRVPVARGAEYLQERS